MGDVLFSPFFANLPGWSPGDWLQPEALSLGEGLKGPLSTQFTLLLLQTGDASFSATAQNIGSKGERVIALESGMMFLNTGYHITLEHL